MDRCDLVAFTVSGRCLALPLADIGRIIAVPRLVAPVGGPAFLEGFLDLAGRQIPVLRADRLLDLGDEPLDVYSPLMLLKSADQPLALHVARVVSIVKSAEVAPLGKDETFNGCVVGRFHLQGRPAYVLSVEQMLLAEERARVAHLAAAMQRRRAGLIGADAGAGDVG